MARVGLPDMRPWGRRSLAIPPESRSAWMQLAIWELWMGGLVAITAGFGVIFIVMAPTRVMTRVDLSACYEVPLSRLPCDRIVYIGGGLDAAFTALCGLTLVGTAIWFVWELWLAVEPKPITDDFLRLLNDSFGRDWRNPLKWPWRRVLYAYGFTAAGAILTATLAVSLWTMLATSAQPHRASPRVETSQGYRFARP
jgi:hypothetical protein